jgi:hypothetical protein
MCSVPDFGFRIFLGWFFVFLFPSVATGAVSDIRCGSGRPFESTLRRARGAGGSGSKVGEDVGPRARVMEMEFEFEEDRDQMAGQKVRLNITRPDCPLRSFNQVDH